MAGTSESQPRKVRWTVPAIDISVSRWLDVQVSISNSLSALIRDSIERDGYVDVIHRPVEQLPRRGRPPQGESTERAGDESDSRNARAAVTEANAAACRERDAARGFGSREVTVAIEVPAAAQAAPVVATASAEAGAEHEVEDPGAASVPTQVDMNAIFGHGA